MKKTLMLALTLLILASCSNDLKDENDNLTAKGFMSTYSKDNRGVDHSDSGLKGFVSLNGLNGDEEIANIYVSNNEIEVLNISEFSDLLRIVADNNNIRYFWDVKYPTDIKHIDLSHNELESLDGVELLTELKTLNVAHNKLDEEDFKILWDLKNLQFIGVEGNDVSDDFLNNMNGFNAKYLRSIKQ